MKNKQNKDSKFIAIPKKVTDDNLAYAFLLYETGDFSNARLFVNKLFCIVDHVQDMLKLHWGRLYLSMIQKFAELADGTNKNDTRIFDELKSLRYRIENRGPESYMQIISSKCSLMHYFIMNAYIFSTEVDYDYQIELFSNESYMSAILISSPHLLRYLILMLIVSKNKKKMSRYTLQNLTNTYENNLCEYKDNVVDFARSLFVDFNFPGANEKIKGFQAEISQDLLMSNCVDLMIGNSKELLFEVYCGIYNSIDIDLISEYLGLSHDDSEIWIVNLIRKNNIKARFSTDDKNILE